ncbi:MAG TPA: MBL fold metallo-hydrolase [Candidatus Obscuribacterales bacterium]
MTLTYLGHSAVKFEVAGLHVYVDPYFRDPVDWTKFPRGDVVLLSHGHFDHGVLLSPKLWEEWHCKFIGPDELIDWMAKKYRRRIPADALIPISHNETLKFGDIAIKAVPAHHPINRLGKTILALNARSSAPGKPVNGYYLSGYYHGGDTIYTPAIAESLRGMQVHTACLPIGGKYAVASPQEALRIAEEIAADRLVPLHWQPLLERIPFRYQSSDLVKLANSRMTKVEVCALAIGEVLAPCEKAQSSA